MGAKKKGGREEDNLVNEQCLQAVVLADSFETSFRPATLDTPKVLLPICGSPMLDYTLEFLAKSGVGEIFVLCVAHAAKIQSYVEARRAEGRWLRARDGSELLVRCLAMKGCGSAGDVLRELDQRGVVKSDPFVLMSGDVVANVGCIETIVEEHRARRKSDADATLTIVLARGGARSSRLRPLPKEELVLALDAATGQVLSWHDVAWTSASSPCNEWDVERLCSFASGAEIRADLVDCGVDVCSPEVLWRYSENFDYQELRRDFVANEVANVELGQKVFARVLGDAEGYGARVHDPRLLDAVSTDVLRRWAYPLTPDAMSQASAACPAKGTARAATAVGRERGAYRDADVVLPRSSAAKVEAPLLLGSRCTLGERCVVRRSTLDCDVTLDDDASVVGSHLGARCVVMKGAKVESSMLAADVVVMEGAVVSRGCVLGEGVVIGKGVVLEAFERVSAKRVQPGESDASLVGEDGVGKRFLVGLEEGSDSEEDDDGDVSTIDDDCDEDAVPVLDTRKATSIGATHEAALKQKAWADWRDDDDCEEDDCDASKATKSSKDKGTTPAKSTNRAEETDEESDDDDEEGDFGGEDEEGSVDFCDADDAVGFGAPSAESTAAFATTVREMIASGAAAGANVDSMVMEINCYKLSENRSFRDGARPALEAVLELVAKDAAGKGKAALVAALKHNVQRWRPLLKKLLSSSPQDEAHALTVLEHLATTNTCATLLDDPDVFRAAVQLMYEADIFTDEGLLKWAHDHATADPKALFNSPQIQDFIEWLGDDDDDDDDDDEEED